MTLAGKVAMVTGGGRGIGRAIALRFAREGASIAVTARTASEIEAVAAEIHKQGGHAFAVAADVTQEADCVRIVAAAREKFGAIHILVNNAGIFGPVKPVEEIAPADWDAVLAVNLRSAYLLTRLVVPEMCRRGSGVILNMSSVAAKAAYPWNAPYAASKAALLALTRTVAAETARSGVRVNALCPGPVFETRMSQELGQTLANKLGTDAEHQRAQFAEGILQGRGQTAEEIAAAALFLVSDEARVITGQSLNADGGMVF